MHCTACASEALIGLACVLALGEEGRVESCSGLVALAPYSEARVTVPRNRSLQVDATTRKRRPCTWLTRAHQLWFRSRHRGYSDKTKHGPIPPQPRDTVWLA